MSIRLSKVTEELNIGVQTIAELLQNKGMSLDDISPNARLSDEQYDAIINYYGAGKRLFSIYWKEDFFTVDPDTNRENLDSHGWSKLRDDTMILLPTRMIFVPKDQSKIDKLAFWTLTDVKEKCKEAIDGRRVIKERLSAPSGNIPVSPYVDNEGSDSPNPQENLLRIKAPKIDMRPRLLGSIDLSALDALTRPIKKTKEERKREREEQLNKHNLLNKPTLKERSNNNLESDVNTIRDIWQRFVDIQEKIIKQSCTPVSILPESIEIENDKLYVTVDETSSEQQVDQIIKGQLGVEDYDINSGSIWVDESKWDSLSENELSDIRKGLSEKYIELDTTPSIDVTINYANGMGRTDQLSIDELTQLDSIIKNGKLIEGHIEDSAAFISKISVSREEYMKYLFGEHYVTYEKKKKKQTESTIIELLEYRNQYIPWEIMQQHSDIVLTCKYYTIIFKINNPAANEELKDSFDCYFPNTDTFEFCRSFTKKDPVFEGYIEEVNDNIDAFLDYATMYCNKDDINIDVLFVYTVSKHQLVKSKLREVGTFVASKGSDYRYNGETGAIGIDFNWRNQDVSQLITEIEDAVPFIKVNVHDEHRYKCKVYTQLAGFEELKTALEDKYEDIFVENDSINHQIKIKLPYIESELYTNLSINLESDLKELKYSGVDITFANKVDGKIRLNIKYNSDSRLEDLKDSIEDMKRADFGFTLNEKDIPFGKLLKANYPNLVFDIDAEDEKKEAIIEAFNSKAITTIIPILTGDLEKISRLKSTFTMATSGQELVNPRLQNFIFDSSQARKTNDIEDILKQDGFVYKDFCRHLLNENINEPQKQAILKAMYAEDMAIIQGPPGTGKSTAIAELIWQLIRKGLQQGNKRERILLTSETNLAVDNAIARIVNTKTNLVKPVRFGGEEKLESEGLQFSIELMKRWVEEGDSCFTSTDDEEDVDSSFEKSLILKNWLGNISRRAFYGIEDDDKHIVSKWQNYLDNPSKVLREITYQRYIENANIVGATCSSIGDKRAGNKEFNGFTQFFHNYCDVFKQRNKSKAKIEFTTVIQDESSKATPAELVLPFVYGERAIVIGDHRQLPPMLDKEEFENTLEYALKAAITDTDKEEIKKLRQYVEEHFNEMEISHFQRLYEHIDSSLKGTFNLQYRMHPDINDVIEQFYREDGGLRCGLVYPNDLGVNDKDVTKPTSRYHGIDIPGLIDHNTHVLFIDTTSPEMMDGTSRVNYGEIETIDKLLSRFEASSSFNRYLSKFSKEEDKQIGIISFYGKQIKQLKAISYKHPNLSTRVSTVDRFQGMERNIVIVSMVRSNLIQSSKNQKADWKRYHDYGYATQNSLGFAQSPNRLNVALSRAKRLLVIVGNKELFSSLDIYNRLFSTIESNTNNKVLKQNEI